MGENRISGEAWRTIRLCVDSYEEGVLAGRFYHPGTAESGQTFRSLAQFLTKVEGLLDEANFPQSFTMRRSFAPIAKPPEEATAPDAAVNGSEATFVIRLMFRQHASWQGSVTWLEGGGEQSFRSVLELILLIDSALGGC